MPDERMNERILFCTDFSQNARAAFFQALRLTEANDGCELIIFHVVPEPNAQFWKSYIYEVEEIDKKARADIDEKLEKEYTSHIPDRVSWRFEAAVGKAEQKILEKAETGDVDLIVIGRQGSSRVRTWFYGNTVGRIVRHSVCPVLVVPFRPGGA